MRSWGGQANANVCGRGRLKVMRDMQTERGAARDGEAVGHSCARAVGTPTRASNPDTAARAGPRAGGGTNPAPPAQLSAADADVALPDPRILPTQRHMSIVPPPFHCHAGYAWMLALRTAQNQPNVQVRNAVR